MVRARTVVRNAAHNRKQAQRSSDTSAEATSLRGGLAPMDSARSKAINYRSLRVGRSVAPPGQRPLDLQAMHGL